MWQIENGVIKLQLAGGGYLIPSAKELYAQAKTDVFRYNDAILPPLSSLGVRFSSLIERPILKIKKDKNITAHLVVIKKGISYNVGVFEKSFVDYIIIDGVWKYLGDVNERINAILSQYSIDCLNLSYLQYAIFKRELTKESIEYEDDVPSLLNSIATSTEIKMPSDLHAVLFPYQSEGSRWLDYMVRNQCGCILGDEMGLGKTLQIITVMGLMKERTENPHFLVVCPISLLENWRREIQKFYPSLTSLIHYGPNRTGDYRQLLTYDVVIMPYSSTITDSGMLTMITWDLLVIDEAQNIKNPKAQRTKAVKNIKRVVPIAVTGTPFENHMTDIWSLVDFVLPGFLGNLYNFENTYLDDIRSAVKIEQFISPILLRRRVRDVAKDLPERIDIPQPIMMTEEEALLYEHNRVSDNPIQELRSMQLSKIQTLRTFCTHPCVYDEQYSCESPLTISNKYNRLCEILQEIFESKEKVVIFTSFRRMIDMLCSDIAQRFNVYTDFIDGTVLAADRQLIVDKFSMHEEPGALILNPKAAGTGLNITCANHAIHYNLEWNPAVEDQASARIYRRGQEKTVFIHRLYYVNTIEEIINEKILMKRQLSDSAIIGNTGSMTEGNYLLKALSASPYTK